MAGAEVRLVESCLVTPAAMTPRKALRLSPLDLMLANRGITPLVHFYRRRPAGEAGHEDFFDVTRLKTALGKALVAFYPMAGRLRADTDGRLEIDCNGKGVLFVVAHSRLTVDDFGDFEPSPRLRRLFVPHMDSTEVYGIQVTFLKCGGVVLGTAMHHGAMDGTAVLHFFRTWVAFSMDDGDQPVANLIPCHDRTILCARDPPVVHPDVLSLFCLNINIRRPAPPVANEVLTLHRNQLSALKRACGGVSTFNAVSAHLWQCVCLARRLPADSTTRLAFAANVRGCMAPPLPDGYFGNAVINVSVASEARDIASGELADIARRIKDALGRVDDEMVRSAIDHLELDLPKRDGRPAVGSLPATDMRVVSWLGMPLYDADFGWGKPLAMLRAESNRGGFVHLIDSVHGDGSVRLVVAMEPAVLVEFKRFLYARFNGMVHSKF